MKTKDIRNAANGTLKARLTILGKNPDQSPEQQAEGTRIQRELDRRARLAAVPSNWQLQIDPATIPNTEVPAGFRSKRSAHLFRNKLVRLGLLPTPEAAIAIDSNAKEDA